MVKSFFIVQLSSDGYFLRGESFTENMDPIGFSLTTLQFIRPARTTLIFSPINSSEPVLLEMIKY